ncbi:MAG: SMP-30/gluconolactonase/LRE family protein [Pseudomonadota bacterium]
MVPPVEILSIDCVADEKALLGEGPLWDPRINRLIWLDIKGDALFLFDPATLSNKRYKASDMISAVGLAKGGDYICVNRQGFHRLQIKDDSLMFEKIIDPEKDLPGNRFNDGKIDPAGGFWAGTMDNAEKRASGQWWRLSPGGDAGNLLKDFMVTNGPAFDDERGCVFLTDSAKQRIFRACSDGQSLSEIEVFLQFEPEDGFPDGMDIDRFGCLWVAFWDGGVVRRFSPEGELLSQVAIGVPRPTSVAIVADRLYVTSASIGLNENVISQSPQSGGLFCLKANANLEKNKVYQYSS